MTEQNRTPFHDPRTFQQLPRVSGLELAPDGHRLVTTVSSINPEHTEFVTALWQLDPHGERPARRLTLGATGERGMAFTPEGDLLFTAARPDPRRERDAKEEPPVALWLLPRDGGEASLVTSRPGGVGTPSVAARAGTLLVSSMTMPGAASAEADTRLRTERREKKVTAILHAGYPVRHWDHDLGPDQPRLLVGEVGRRDDWSDLIPQPGEALRDAHAEISADGATVVTDWRVAQPHGASRGTVASIDVASGRRNVLLDDPGYEFSAPKLSPDGRQVAALRERRGTPDTAVRVELVLVPLAGGPVRELTPGWDLWPTDARWTPDSAALIVTADQNGRGPLFRIPLDGTEPLRLTVDDAAYSNPRPAPDGRTVYALRHAVDAPPEAVRLEAAAPDQRPVRLPGPAERPELPGTVTEVSAHAEDGTELRGWLAVPHGAQRDPAPLLLWIHGGPLGSWNTWHWRWNPWLMVARGYAVLLPDPALSTGYGQAFVQRGWGRWGQQPYTDVLALTDAAQARPDIDATRSAAMGGSFGGYLANWLAGHTDRFDAIVTHASLWALEQFWPSTDAAYYWLTEMSERMTELNSPHRHIDSITTPMLVIHGDKDYRVPIGEALRLWWDLMARQPDPAEQPHRFLYFPDEGHWVLTPNHAVLWYETVLAFLGHHVLGQPLAMPELLG